MDYEKLYKDALERMKSWVRGEHPECFSKAQKAAEFIFPELAESEDEKIRKELIEHIKANYEADYVLFKKFSPDDVIAWLEKQGEQKSLNDVIKEVTKNKETAMSFLKSCGIMNANGELADEYKIEQGEKKSFDYESANIQQKDFVPKVESKFHKGDWVVRGGTIAQILDVQEQYYVGLDVNGKDFTSSRFLNDDKIHLWTIKDAKDGDVLASKDGESILIFRNLDTSISFSSYYNIQGKGELGWANDCFIPATKEQCGLLFEKMKESGYVWDAEKKELKKIEVTSKESEDEGIKTAILNHLKKMWGNCQDDVCGVNVEDAIAWLEKQGKKLDADKVIEWLRFHIQVDDPKIEYNEDGQPLAESFIAHAKARCVAADEVVKKFKQDFKL